MANDTLNFSIPSRWNTLGGMTVTGGELTVSPPNTGGTYVYSYPKDGFFEPIEVGEEYNVSIVVSRHSGAAKNVAIHIYEYATNDESSYLGQSLLAAHNVTGTGTYGPQTYTVGNDGFAEIAIQMPDNDNDWAIDEVIFVPVGAGGQTIIGSILTDADAFGDGVASPGAVAVSGVNYADSDLFGAGGLASYVGFSGAEFIDPDSFGSGVAAPEPAGISGSVHVDGDAFGSGALSAGDAIIGGSQHSNQSGFGGGQIAPGSVGIAGSRHIDLDEFFSGLVGAGGLVIAGSLHGDVDVFGGGNLSAGNVIISGVAYVDPDTFGSGIVSTSGAPKIILGSSHDDADAFGGGAVGVQQVTIVGTIYSDADGFGSGSVASDGVTIVGTAMVDPDQFNSGQVSIGGAHITGAVLLNAQTFPVGSIATGAVSIIGAHFVDGDVFGSGTLFPFAEYSPRLSIDGSPAGPTIIIGTPAGAQQIIGDAGMTPINIDAFYHGEPIEISLFAKDPGGADVIANPGSQTIKIAIGPLDGGAAVVDLDDRFTLIDTPTGEFRITLGVNDYTGVLAEGENYLYTIWSQYGAQDPRVQRWGEVRLRKSISAA